MSVSTIRIEIVIAGFVYFISFFFGILLLFNVTDLSFILQYTDFVAFFLLGAVAISYVFGVMAHRLIPLIMTPLRKIVTKYQLGKVFIYNDEGKDVYKEIVNSWKCSTDRIHRGLDYHYSLLLLFRLLIPAIGLLGISLSMWLYKASLGSHVFKVIIITSIFICFTYLAFRCQRNIFKSIQDNVFIVVQSLKQVETEAKPDGE